jgi:hypothetical protein
MRLPCAWNRVSGIAACTRVVLAADCRIEWTENPVRIFPVEPDVPVEVRHKHVRFVGRRGGIVNHVVERYAMEAWQ